MIGNLVFAIIMAFCIGLNLAILFNQIDDGEPGRAIFTFIVLLLCGLSLGLNTTSVSRGLKHPKVEVREMPKIDTLTVIQGQDTTRTYILDFSQLPQPVKQLDL